MVDRQRGRHRRGAADRDGAWARKPTCWTRRGGCRPFHRRRRRCRRGHSAAGRQRPGAIYVDSTGRRFCNESNSYVEVGKAMYANKAVPCWIIFDEGYVRRYVSTSNPLKRAAARRADRAGRRQARRTPSPSWHARSTFPPTNWTHTIRASTSSRPRASTPTSGADNRRTTTASVIPGTGRTPRSARSNRAPYYATRVFPPMSGRAAG